MTNNDDKNMCYDFHKIEKEWVGRSGLSVGSISSDDCFSIAVPSLAAGYDLTVGRLRYFAIADVLARFAGMQGREVCFPLVWNGFTEIIEKKAAKYSVEPDKLAEKEKVAQKEIMQRLGIGHNRKQEFSTADPNFVRWLHEIFIKMYKADHIYYKVITVPWCPDCKNFLPGDPDADKICWRCGDELGYKKVKGWYLNIGKFKEELRQDLENITEWPSLVRNNLRNLLVRNIALDSWDCCLTSDSEYGIPIPKSVCEESGQEPANFNEFSLTLFSRLYSDAHISQTPIDLFVGSTFGWDQNFDLLVWWTLSKIVADVDFLDFSIPFKEILYRGNVQRQIKCSAGGLRGKEINPGPIMEEYGSDVLRFLLLVYAPPGNHIDWREVESNATLQGIGRMLKRLYGYIQSNKAVFSGESVVPEEFNKTDRELRRKAHKTIKLVTEKIEEHKLDIAAHGCFSLARELLKYSDQKKQIHPVVQRESAEILLRLLSPFTPCICMELWSEIGNDPSLLFTSWPRWDKEGIKDEERLVVVQVNGKTRVKIVVDADATEEEIVSLARQDAKVAKHLGQDEISNVFFIKGKLLNLCH